MCANYIHNETAGAERTERVLEVGDELPGDTAIRPLRNQRRQINDTRNGSEAPRILLVEDDSAAGRLFELAMEEASEQVTVDVATDGQQALDRLDEVPDDDQKRSLVVVLDLDLPRVDGTEVLRRIRANAELSDLPVVILSQRDSQATIDECFRLGASAYYVKPDGYDGLLDVAKRIGSFWSGRETDTVRL